MMPARQLRHCSPVRSGVHCTSPYTTLTPCSSNHVSPVAYRLGDDDDPKAARSAVLFISSVAFAMNRAAASAPATSFMFLPDQSGSLSPGSERRRPSLV
ncbi:Os01g0341750 [Oryza sativa Japonica Group]|uniref:Os01g0341750 protein n=1 Tax=Oryza sativa subsp. japonica TaxID=39947 RepID=A0A0P0V230_ORYSJ|nr:hypothetical protein EE612_002380 [Oryza sativa]BAS71978.1 Os01g0341750 [Oryza sativa Japonica Group]